MKYLILLISLLLLSGCTQTIANKAKANGWSKIIEAKTISLAEKDCTNHFGYHTSYQYEQWHGWSNNYYTYHSVELICKDGYIVNYTIEQINNHYSPKVAELLK